MKLVDDYLDCLVDDKGGRDSVGNAEFKAMEIGQAARVCWLSALSSGSAEGLKEAARYMSIELKSLTSIGLERRQKPVPSAIDLVQGKS